MTQSQDSLVGDVRRWLVEHAQPPEAPAVMAALRDRSTVVGAAQLLDILSILRAELTGAGPLQELLRAEGCTDVLVNGTDGVWIDDGTTLRSLPSPFADDAQVRRLAQRLAAAAGRRLDDAQPFCDARLPDGSRLHVALDCVASPGTLISVRLPPRGRFTVGDLVDRGSLCADGAAWLRALVDARATFLVSGGTGTGKTTVLSALLGLVAAHERIVVLEDAPELRPRHPHVCALHGRTPNIEGRGALGLIDLVRQALRMRPDRLVVGEVRGAEVVALLAAFNTGHDGGAGTIHAGAAERVPARIEALALAAGLHRGAAHAQMAAGLDAVVHLERRAGRRRVVSIAEMQRGPDESCAAVEVIRLEPDGPRITDPGAALVRRLAAHRC
jgi:pilus assembly protein CpaF